MMVSLLKTTGDSLHGSLVSHLVILKEPTREPWEGGVGAVLQASLEALPHSTVILQSRFSSCRVRFFVFLCYHLLVVLFIDPV